MKKLLLSLFLISGITYGQGDPAPYIKGQAATGLGNQASTVFVPNQQSTKINAYQARIETGNGNLLSNPSFEAGTYNSGWTCSLGSTTLETTAKTDGNKANAINSTGAGVRCYQTSTTNAANLKGLLGSAILKVKTTDSIYKVCGLVDGNAAANERNCITVKPTSADLVFYPARTDFYMGGTSNGIVVYTTTTTSQPTVIDDAFVGVFNGGISQFSQNTGFVNAGTITIGATTTAPTKGTIVTDRIMWKRDTTNLIASYQYQQSTAGTAGSGDYIYTLPVVNGTQLSFDTNIVTPYSGSLYSGAAASPKATVGTASSSTSSEQSVGRLIAYSATQFRVFNVFVSSANGISNGNTLGSSSFGLGNSTQGYQFNIDAPIAGWEANTNAAIAGCVDAFGCTETLIARYAGAGGLPTSTNIPGSFFGSASVSDTSLYTIPLTGFTSAPLCEANVFASETNANPTATVVSTSSSSLVIRTGYSQAGLNFVKAVYSFTVSCTKTGADFKPKTVVVSPLQGYVQTPGLTYPKLFSMKVTTTSGAVSNNKGGVFTTCTAANPTVCTMVGLSSIPNCSATATSGAPIFGLMISATTSTALTIGSYSSPTGSGSASQVLDVVCHGD